MTSNPIAIHACWALLLACASQLHAADAETARKPLGVYVKVDIETAVNGYVGPAPPTPAVLHGYLQKLYADLLADPAISGITVGEHWDHIQVSDAEDPYGSPEDFDWSYLDDAFTVANSMKKQVQLIVTPGVDSPPWLFDETYPCDELFSTGTARKDCGTMTFAGFPEVTHADGKVFPLPWNGVYENAWQAFLVELNAKYVANPGFVSIAIAGPMGASPEIILPTDLNDTVKQPSGKSVNKTWEALIEHSFPKNSSYRETDQVFIESWERAIKAYEKIFSGVTLVISPDGGNDLPEFDGAIPPYPDKMFQKDCANATNFMMSCEAKTEILSYFISAVGPNAKVTRVGGMTASSSTDPGNIGIPGVKLLTSISPPPKPPIHGGAEFDHPVSGSDLQEEGCPEFPKKKCKDLTIEEAANNVLAVFFDGTPAAATYGGTPGKAPIQYLEVPYADVQYALAHPCPAILNGFDNTSLQDLLNRARHDLLEMAGRSETLPPPTCDMH